MLLFVSIFAVIITALSAVLKIYFVLTNTRCKSKVCLSGKTALVTGGNSGCATMRCQCKKNKLSCLGNSGCSGDNSCQNEYTGRGITVVEEADGIGYEIVLALLSRGCRVIIADKELDLDLQVKILRETHNANIVLKYVDLASFKSVREFAKSVVQSEDKLDILIHNAAIMAGTERYVTEDNLNIVMQVNYFSPFLLTHLLVDLLKNASGGRIIFTGSLTSYTSDFSLRTLTPDEIIQDNYFYYYSNSKFGLILISDLFAQKLRDHKITSNSYHPGYVNTRIFKKTIEPVSKFYGVVFVRVSDIVASLFAKTPEDGAQTAIYLACSNEVKDVTGQFFFETKSIFKPKRAYDEKLCLSTWRATEELVKLESYEKL